MTGRVINLIGGAGVGKTTLAMRIVSDLKSMHHINATYVPEFVKDVIHDDNMKLLEDQLWLFANQARMLRRAAEASDVVVTDAPLLQFLYYLDPSVSEILTGHPYVNLIKHEHDRYESLNLEVPREVPYQQEGRYQSEEEAIAMDAKLIEALNTYHPEAMDKSEVLTPFGYQRFPLGLSRILEFINT